MIVSDIELTYNAIEAEARASLQFIRDQRIARGAQRAAQEDLDLIAAIAETEAQEQMDRQYALTLSNNPNAPPPTSAASRATHTQGFEIGSAYRSRQPASPSSSGSSPPRPWSAVDSLKSLQGSITPGSSVCDSLR
jgi:hypothetical protein